MIIVNIHTTKCVIERLCKESNDAARKPSYVRGHFKVINGKRVYVKPYYRKR